MATDTTAFMVRLSREDYERLRIEAFHARRKMSEIVREALTERWERQS